MVVSDDEDDELLFKGRSSKDRPKTRVGTVTSAYELLTLAAAA